MGELTTEGTIFVMLGWGSVITLVSYCLYKVMTGKRNYEKE